MALIVDVTRKDLHCDECDALGAMLVRVLAQRLRICRDCWRKLEALVKETEGGAPKAELQ